MRNFFLVVNTTLATLLVCVMLAGSLRFESNAHAQTKFNPCTVLTNEEVINPTLHAVEGAFADVGATPDGPIRPVTGVRFEFMPAGTDRVFNIQTLPREAFTLTYDDPDPLKDCWTTPFFPVPGIKNDGARFQSLVRLVDEIGITSEASNLSQVFLFPRAPRPAPVYRVGQ